MTELSDPSVVLPACCFAPIRWYDFMLHENALIDIFENYPKQTFRNRFEICNSQGRCRLTLPVEGQKGIKTPIKDIRLSEGKWRHLHLAAIRSAYGKSGFYIHLEEDLHHLFENNNLRYLIDFNRRAFGLLSPFLPQLKWKESSTYIEPTSSLTDGRSWWEPSREWKALPAYPQVFGDRLPFQNNLSILDAVMNLGPRAMDYLLLFKNGEQAV